MLIREINMGDIDQTFELRNLKSSYKFFKNQSMVDSVDHFNWATNRIVNYPKLTLIAENRNKILGICYLEVQDVNKIGTISINTYPDIQGSGLAQKLCLALFENAKDLKIEKIRAVILKSNLRSLSFFRKMNFNQESAIDEDFVYFSKLL